MPWRANPYWISKIISGGGGPTSIRILLIAAATFFISDSGSDANDGLTSGTAWFTTAPLFNKYDFGGQTVTLKLAGDITHQIIIDSWVGGGALILDGQTHKITYVGTNQRFDATVFITGGANPGPFTIQNVALLGTKTWANLYLLSSSRLVIGAGLVLAGGVTAGVPTIQDQIIIENGGGRIDLANSFTVGDGSALSGSTVNALLFGNSGQFFNTADAITVTFANNVQYTNIITAQGDTFMYLGNTSWAPGVHTVTANKGNLSFPATLLMGPQGASTIPGTGTVTVGGGQLQGPP